MGACAVEMEVFLLEWIRTLRDCFSQFNRSQGHCHADLKEEEEDPDAKNRSRHRSAFNACFSNAVHKNESARVFLTPFVSLAMGHCRERDTLMCLLFGKDGPVIDFQDYFEELLSVSFTRKLAS